MAIDQYAWGEALRSLLAGLRTGQASDSVRLVDDLAVSALRGGILCVAPLGETRPLECAQRLMRIQMADSGRYGHVQVAINQAGRLCALTRLPAADMDSEARSQDALQPLLELLAHATPSP